MQHDVLAMPYGHNCCSPKGQDPSVPFLHMIPDVPVEAATQPPSGMVKTTGGPVVLLLLRQLSQLTWQPSTLHP